MSMLGYLNLLKSTPTASLSYNTFSPTKITGPVTITSSGTVATMNSGTARCQTVNGVNSSSPSPLVYLECRYNSGGIFRIFGLANVTAPPDMINSANGWGLYITSGNVLFKFHSGVGTSLGVTFTNMDTMSFAINMTTNNIYVFKNGVLLNSGPVWTSSDGISGTMYYQVTDNSGGGEVFTGNFGATTLVYYNTCTIGGSSLSSLGYLPGFV